MKTSLKKITLFGDAPDRFLQRIITQDIFSCNSPKLSSICSPKGNVKHIFWIQNNQDSISIWVDQSDAAQLMQTIKYYDPFHTTRFDISNGSIWSNQSFYFSSSPINENNTWKLFLIQNEIPVMHEAIRNKFTPQALKIDQQAVCLSKGCFIGHEIIARVHFKGSIKKQIRYATSKSEPQTFINLYQDTSTFHFIEMAPITS